MFDLVKFGVRDIALSRAFYQQALEPIGGTPGAAHRTGIVIQLTDLKNFCPNRLNLLEQQFEVPSSCPVITQCCSQTMTSFDS